MLGAGGCIARGIISVNRRWYEPAPNNEMGSGVINMKMPKNLGMLLLAVWLILFGLLTASFLHFEVAHSRDLLAVLAIVAGVLLLLQR